MAQRLWCLAARRPAHSVCYYKQLVQKKNDHHALSAGSRNVKTHDFPCDLSFLHPRTSVCQWQACASLYLQPNQILHHDLDNTKLPTCPSLPSSFYYAYIHDTKESPSCTTEQVPTIGLVASSTTSTTSWPGGFHRGIPWPAPLRQQHASSNSVLALHRASTRCNPVPSVPDKLSTPLHQSRHAQLSLRFGGGPGAAGGRRQLHDGGVRRHTAGSGTPGGWSGGPSTPGSIPDPWNPIQTIQGSYSSYTFDTTKPLGEGSFGAVYMGTDTSTGQPVAIKSMHMRGHKMFNANDRTRVYVTREISAMMQMRHPYIVHLYDVVFDPAQQALDDRLYLVMELMPGGNMRELVKESEGEVLPEAEARRFFQQLVQAVSFCHNAHIYHRDLKPQNLLLDASKRTLKVADFGVSAVGAVGAGAGADQLLLSGVGTKKWCGTLRARAAPTTAGPPTSGPAPSSYYFLSGDTPFGADPDAILAGRYAFPRHFSGPVRDLLSAMLHPVPARRATCEQIFESPWFRVGLRLVDYRDIPGVRDNLDAVDTLMRRPVGPGHRVPPADVGLVLPRAPRSWVHRDEPITFGHGKALDLGLGQFLRDDVLMFFPIHDTPPDLILLCVEQLCDEAGYRVDTRFYTITVWEKGQVPPWKLREPLCVIIDILTWSPPHNYMVYCRRVTGSPEVYDQFAAMIVKGSSTMMTLRPS